MSRTTLAMFVGLLLGIVAAFGSFGAFMIVLVFGAVGLVVGLIMDGKIDVPALLGRNSARQ